MKRPPLSTKPRNIEIIVVLFFITPVAFIFSLYYSNLYVGGDQIHYKMLFDYLRNAPIVEIPRLQLKITGSAEPVYGITAWFGARITDKIVWFSFFNAFLISVLYLYIRILKVSVLLFPLIFTNYYIFVLMFSAERLKIAMIMVLIFQISKSRWRYTWAVLAVFSHFQSAMFVFSIFGDLFSKTVRHLYQGKLGKSTLITSTFMIGILGAAFYFYNDRISGKFNYYNGHGISEVYKSGIFSIIALTFSENRLSTFFVFFFIMMLAYRLGDDRVNIIAFMLAIIPTFKWANGLNPISVVLLLYFSMKGLLFLSDVSSYGTGYPSVRF